MKLFKLKIGVSQLDDFTSFCAMYHITVVLAYKVEEFFSSNVIAVITNQGSNGITPEEKERLIMENYSGKLIDKPLNVK